MAQHCGIMSYQRRSSTAVRGASRRDVGIDGLIYYADPTAKVFQDLKVIGRAIGMPTTLLVDPAGCEIGTMAGPAEWASKDGVALVTAALVK